MEEITNKPYSFNPSIRVLVYSARFLSRSMTFVYNQLEAARQLVHVEAAASIRDNAELFPFLDLHLVPSQRTMREALRSIIRRTRFVFPLRNEVFERNLARIGLDRFDLVHAHFGPAGPRLYPVLRQYRVPLLLTFHGRDASQMLRIPGYVRQLRWLFRQPGVHGITVSNMMRSVLQEFGVPSARLTPMYIGTDLEFFAPMANRQGGRDGPFVLLQVSNFVPKKGHEYAVDALAAARRRNCWDSRDVRMIFAGEGPTRRAVERRVADCGLGEIVEFAGPVDRIQVRTLMAGADVFIHPSVTAADGDQEGIPTVLMEALAMGLPVLSTRHSGIPELVRHGSDGLLVPERDSVALAAALEEVIRTPDRFGGEPSRAWVDEHFNLKLQVRKLVALYLKLAREANYKPRVSATVPL